MVEFFVERILSGALSYTEKSILKSKQVRQLQGKLGIENTHPKTNEVLKRASEKAGVAQLPENVLRDFMGDPENLGMILQWVWDPYREGFEIDKFNLHYAVSQKDRANLERFLRSFPNALVKAMEEVLGPEAMIIIKGDERILNELQVAKALIQDIRQNIGKKEEQGINVLIYDRTQDEGVQTLHSKIPPKVLLGTHADPNQGFCESFYLKRHEVDGMLERAIQGGAQIIGLTGKENSGKSRAILNLLNEAFPYAKVFIAQPYLGDRDVSDDMVPLSVEDFQAPEEDNPVEEVFLDPVMSREDPEVITRFFIFNDVSQYKSASWMLRSRIQQIVESYHNNVVILSDSIEEYDDFIKSMGGKIEAEIAEIIIPGLTPEEKEIFKSFVESASNEHGSLGLDNVKPDDTAGSYFIPKRAMLKKYEKIESKALIDHDEDACIQYAILRAYRCTKLWRTINLGRVDILVEYVEKWMNYYFGRNERILPFKLDKAFRELERFGLITKQGKEWKWIFIEPSYLEFIAKDVSDRTLVDEILDFYPKEEAYSKIIGRYHGENFDREQIYQQMLDRNIERGAFTLSALIQHETLFEKRKEWIVRFKEEGVQIKASDFGRVYNVLLSRASNIDQQKEAVELLAKHKEAINDITMPTILSKTDTFEEAIALYELLGKEEARNASGLFVYYGLIARAYTFDEGFYTFTELREAGLSLSAEFLGSVLSLATSYEEVRKVWDAISMSEIIESDLLNSRNVRLLLEKCETIDEMRKFYHELLELGAEKRPYVYNPFIKCSKSFSDSWDIFMELKEGGAVLGRNNYNALIHRADTFEEANKALGLMKVDLTDQVRGDSYYRLLQLAPLREIPELLVDLHEELKHFVDDPDPNQYVPSVHVLLASCATWDACELLIKQHLKERNLKPRPATLAIAASKAESFDHIRYLIEYSVESGVLPQRSFFNVGLRLAESFEQVVYLVEAMVGNKKVLPPRSRFFHALKEHGKTNGKDAIPKERIEIIESLGFRTLRGVEDADWVPFGLIKDARLADDKNAYLTAYLALRLYTIVTDRPKQQFIRAVLKFANDFYDVRELTGVLQEKYPGKVQLNEYSVKWVISRFSGWSFERACAIFTELVEEGALSGPVAYDVLLLIANSYNEVKVVFDMPEKYGGKLDKRNFHTALTKAKDPSHVDEILEYMKRYHVELSSEAVYIIMSQHSNFEKSFEFVKLAIGKSRLVIRDKFWGKKIYNRLMELDAKGEYLTQIKLLMERAGWVH